MSTGLLQLVRFYINFSLFIISMEKNMKQKSYLQASNVFSISNCPPAFWHTSFSSKRNFCPFRSTNGKIWHSLLFNSGKFIRICKFHSILLKYSSKYIFHMQVNIYIHYGTFIHYCYSTCIHLFVVQCSLLPCPSLVHRVQRHFRLSPTKVKEYNLVTVNIFRSSGMLMVMKRHAKNKAKETVKRTSQSRPTETSCGTAKVMANLWCLWIVTSDT